MARYYRKYVSYESIVERQAADFVEEQSEMLAQGIAEDRDFDRNDIDGLDTTWHENVTGRAYTTEDARFVIANSDNVEDDSGLWEGSDPDDALQTQAAFTFSNDVWHAVETVYDEAKASVDDSMDGLEIEPDDSDTDRETVLVREREGAAALIAILDGEGDADHLVVVDADGSRAVASLDADGKLVLDGASRAEGWLLAAAGISLEDGMGADELEEGLRKHFATEAFAAHAAENGISPLERGSEDERVAIRDWMRAGRSSSRGGYPLGSSYIDSRCGALWGTEEHAFVVYDDEMSSLVPHLSGRRRGEVEAYYRETFDGPTPQTAEEMLARVAFMIRDGADGQELWNALPQIDRFASPESDAAPAPGL